MNGVGSNGKSGYMDLIGDRCKWVGAMCRDRRRGISMALLLSIPLMAWAQPLGLLLWARLRLLTNIPRTAMATEEMEAKAKIEPPSSLPDLASVGLDDRANRDPLQFNPEYFPRLNPQPDSGTTEGKYLEKNVDQMRTEASTLASVRSAAEKIRLQALISGKSLAIIDDRTYRAGELLGHESTGGIQFLLQSVGKDSVVVQAEGYEFKVRLVGGVVDKSVSRQWWEE